MLVGGAPTEDIEATIMRGLEALGLRGTDVAVTFSTISLSWSPGEGASPLTLMHLVRVRSGAFSAQAEVATLVRRLAAGEVDLDGAEQALSRIEQGDQPYARPLFLVAPALSAAAATVLFGGSLRDAGVTVAIVLAIEPLRERIESTTLAPFFRLAFTVLLIIAYVIEGGILGLFHNESFRAAMPKPGNGSLEAWFFVAVIMFFALIPFFAYRELARALGSAKLRAMLFGTREDPS